MSFSLIVDGFGVKNVGDKHTKHLTEVLKEHYRITEDLEAEKYSNITLDWDYLRRQVNLSMPGYCKEALMRSQHKLRKFNHQPHRHVVPRYGERYNMQAKRTPQPR